MLNIDKIKTYGRSLTDNGITADWSAAGIEFTAETSGDIFVTAEFWGEENLYFTAYINGEESRICVKDFPTDKKGVFRFPVAQGLEVGRYNIALIRQSEAERGCAKILDIEFEGEYLERPEDNELLIEFIGDSITCGYANLASADMDPEICRTSDFEDATQSYAYLTACALGLDFSMISRQGTGIVAGWDFLTNPMGAIPRVYRLNNFYRDNTPYCPSRLADIVVINLGTNDIYKFLGEEREPTLGDEDFIETIHKVLCDIYEFNNSPKMVVAVGMMTNQTAHEPLYRWYGEAIKRFEASKGDKIHFCNLPENYDGGKAHPSVEGHRAAAAVLTDFLKKII